MGRVGREGGMERPICMTELGFYPEDQQGASQYLLPRLLHWPMFWLLPRNIFDSTIWTLSQVGGYCGGHEGDSRHALTDMEQEGCVMPFAIVSQSGRVYSNPNRDYRETMWEKPSRQNAGYGTE